MSKQIALSILQDLKQHHENTIASEGGGYYGSDEIVANAKEDIREIEEAIDWVMKQ